MKKENFLSLEDLENVVGGRAFTKEDQDHGMEVWERYLKLEELYKSRGMYYSHWKKIDDEFNKARIKWIEDLYNAPESSPTISFYDYFDFEYWENY